LKAKLNTTTLKQITPKDKAFEVVDSDIKGFLIRVQPTGRKTGYNSYRTPSGKRKRIKIGVIGSELTIIQTRDRAIALAGKVAEGVDVQSEKSSVIKRARFQQHNTLQLFVEHSYRPWA